MDRKIIGDITHNVRIKMYPDGTQDVLVASRAIFREPGWEEERPKVKTASGKGSGEADDRARRRARSMVRDYCMANTDLRYFVTLTIAPDKLDRYDINAIMSKANRWLDNRVRRNGLKYVLVPELHKDGAVHFHGLINEALPLVDSGTLTGGELKRPRKPRSKAEKSALLASGSTVVYNLPDWSYGFTTVMELYGERSKAVSYVCKYVSKTTDKIGGRWYYSGGKLRKPDVIYDDADFDDVGDGDSGRFVIPGLGVECVCMRLGG